MRSQVPVRDGFTASTFIETKGRLLEIIGMPRKGGTTASLVPPPPGPFPRAAERMYEVDLSNWQTNKRRPSRVIIYSAYTGSNLRKGMLRAWWDLQNYGGAFHRYQRMLRRHHLLPVDDYISRTELERPHQIIQPLRRALLLVVAYNRSTRKPVGMLSRGLWKPRTPERPFTEPQRGCPLGDYTKVALGRDSPRGLNLAMDAELQSLCRHANAEENLRQRTTIVADLHQ